MDGGLQLTGVLAVGRGGIGGAPVPDYSSTEAGQPLPTVAGAELRSHAYVVPRPIFALSSYFLRPVQLAGQY
jgi:hypothetical protein